MKVTIHRSKSGYQIVQEEANKGKTPPQYEDNMAMLMPVLDRQTKGTYTYKYNINGDLLIIIFERLLQINQRDNTVEFWRKVNDYYANLIIRVPQNGLELDISTYPLELDRLVRQPDGTYDKVNTVVEFPNNITDFIQFKVLQAHPDVAQNRIAVNRHSYYIEDNNVIKQASLDEIKTSKKAQGYYLNAKEEDYEMYLYLLRGYGIKDKQLEVSNLSLMPLEEKSILLDRLVKDFPTLFIRAVEDEDNKLKYYVELLVFYDKIEKYNTEYYYMGNPIGKDIEEVMKWLKSPSNNDKRLKLYQALHEEINKASLPINVTELNALLDTKTKSKK